MTEAALLNRTVIGKSTAWLVLQRWRDGSVRVAQAQFTDTATAGEEKTYEIGVGDALTAAFARHAWAEALIGDLELGGEVRDTFDVAYRAVVQADAVGETVQSTSLMRVKRHRVYHEASSGGIGRDYLTSTFYVAEFKDVPIIVVDWILGNDYLGADVPAGSPDKNLYPLGTVDVNLAHFLVKGGVGTNIAPYRAVKDGIGSAEAMSASFTGYQVIEDDYMGDGQTKRYRFFISLIPAGSDPAETTIVANTLAAMQSYPMFGLVSQEAWEQSRAGGVVGGPIAGPTNAAALAAAELATWEAANHFGTWGSRSDVLDTETAGTPRNTPLSESWAHAIQGAHPDLLIKLEGMAWAQSMRACHLYGLELDDETTSTLWTGMPHLVILTGETFGRRALDSADPYSAYRTRSGGSISLHHDWKGYDYEHFTVDLLFDYWTATGDAWAQEELRQLGQSLKALVKLEVGAYTATLRSARGEGWCLKALVQCHLATQDDSLKTFGMRRVNEIIDPQRNSAHASEALVFETEEDPPPANRTGFAENAEFFMPWQHGAVLYGFLGAYRMWGEPILLEIAESVAATVEYSWVSNVTQAPFGLVAQGLRYYVPVTEGGSPVAANHYDGTVGIQFGDGPLSGAHTFLTAGLFHLAELTSDTSIATDARYYGEILRGSLASLDRTNRWNYCLPPIMTKVLFADPGPDPDTGDSMVSDFFTATVDGDPAVVLQFMETAAYYTVRKMFNAGETLRRAWLRFESNQPYDVDIGLVSGEITTDTVVCIVPHKPYTIVDGKIRLTMQTNDFCVITIGAFEDGIQTGTRCLLAIQTLPILPAPTGTVVVYDGSQTEVASGTTLHITSGHVNLGQRFLVNANGKLRIDGPAMAKGSVWGNQNPNWRFEGHGTLNMTWATIEEIHALQDPADPNAAFDQMMAYAAVSNAAPPVYTFQNGVSIDGPAIIGNAFYGVMDVSVAKNLMVLSMAAPGTDGLKVHQSSNAVNGEVDNILIVSGDDAYSGSEEWRGRIIGSKMFLASYTASSFLGSYWPSASGTNQSRYSNLHIWAIQSFQTWNHPWALAQAGNLFQFWCDGDNAAHVVSNMEFDGVRVWARPDGQIEARPAVIGNVLYPWDSVNQNSRLGRVEDCIWRNVWFETTPTLKSQIIGLDANNAPRRLSFINWIFGGNRATQLGGTALRTTNFTSYFEISTFASGIVFETPTGTGGGTGGRGGTGGLTGGPVGTIGDPVVGTQSPLNLIVVETGAGLSNANSFCAIDTADQYVAAHGGHAEWEAATLQEKEDWLILATRWINWKFKFNGRKRRETQALAFPRMGLYDEDEYYVSHESVPLRVQQATILVAMRLAQGDFTPFPDEANSGAVTGSSISVGPIAISEQFSSPRVASSEPRLPLVEKLIQPFLRPSRGINLIR